MQRLPVDSYYALVVYSKDSQICTGLRKGSGVFARIPKHEVGYVYHKRTLWDSYPTLRRSSSLGGAKLWKETIE